MKIHLVLIFFHMIVLVISNADAGIFEGGTVTNEDKILARVWRGDAQTPYPETAMLDEQGKANSAIAVSGGGLRAYMSTLGYFRALLDLGLLNRTRYISSVSGGSWATAAYTYHSSNASKGPEHVLGPIHPPERLNWYNLRRIEIGCARKVPSNLDVLMQALYNLFYKRYDPLEVWYRTVAEVFLKPVGIKLNALFSWNRTVVADIVRRNQWLIEEDFVLPCDGEEPCYHRPYPIINSAILGPQDSAPFGIFGMGFTGLETTPLYIGSVHSHTVKYKRFPYVAVAKRRLRADNDYSQITFGGMVEPVAFGGSNILRNVTSNTGDVVTVPEPFFGLGPGKDTGIIEVPRSLWPFTLANATATSSWAPGSLLSAESVANNILNKYIGLRSTYWSPIAQSTGRAIFSTDILLADGGSLENQGLMPLLRRGVSKIAVFVTTCVPLKPRSDFNPFLRLPRDSDLDSSISSFFGFTDIIPIPGFDYYHNHVFHRSDFPWLVDDLQKAQAAGKGIVAKTRLRTIKNDWWGIPENHTVDIVWVYLGRVFEWEKRLPSSLGKLLVPEQNAENPSVLISKGPYKDFPHIGTDVLNYSPQLANILASLAGWVIQQNAKIFVDLLS